MPETTSTCYLSLSALLLGLAHLYASPKRVLATVSVLMRNSLERYWTIVLAIVRKRPEMTLNTTQYFRPVVHKFTKLKIKCIDAILHKGIRILVKWIGGIVYKEAKQTLYV